MKRNILTGAMALGMAAAVSCGALASDAASQGGNMPSVSQALTLATPYAENVSTQEEIESLYTFTLEGVTYSLPLTVQELEENGWEFYQSTDRAQKIPGMTVSGCWMVKDADSEKEVRFSLLNATGNALEAQDARVAGIDVEADANVEFTLGSGLKIGSAASEVEATYGASEDYVYEFSEIIREKGSDMEESLRAMSLVFSEAADSDSTVFSMDESGNVEEIEINYYKTFPEDATDVSGRPDYLDEYVAPAAMDDSLAIPTIELDGVLYQLPVPLSELTANGWEMEEEEVVYGQNNNSSIHLTKGGREITVDVDNLSDLMVNAEDAIVTSLQLNLYDEQSQDIVSIAGGINATSTIDDVKGIFPALNEVPLEDGSGSLEKDGMRYYINDYQSEDSDYHSYSISLSNLEHRSNQIYINYNLDKKDTPTSITISGDEWNYTS